jgi:hypothetical protein
MSVLQDQASRSDGRIPTRLVGSYAQPNWLIANRFAMALEGVDIENPYSDWRTTA